MSTVKLTEQSFEEEVIKSDRPVLVDFFATWCGPCKMLHPIIEEIAEEHSEYKVCKIDVDEERGLAMRFGVMSIPTVIIFKNGEISDTVVGLRSKYDLLDLLA